MVEAFFAYALSAEPELQHKPALNDTDVATVAPRAAAHIQKSPSHNDRGFCAKRGVVYATRSTISNGGFGRFGARR